MRRPQLIILQSYTLIQTSTDKWQIKSITFKSIPSFFLFFDGLNLEEILLSCRNWQFKNQVNNVVSPRKRNRLQHKILDDLVFVCYSLQGQDGNVYKLA